MTNHFKPPTIGFEHFGFPLARLRRGDVHHLVPIGMPRLRPQLSQCVFYLYGRDPRDPERITGPWGTGFIVARVADTVWPTAHHYAITNWHVAVQQGHSIIRLNTKDGKTRFLEYEPTDWQFIPGGDDIAAVDVTDDIRETDEIFVQSPASFVTRDLITDYEIGFGEDVFMVGMFLSHYGGKRNVPAARFGNLSMLANDAAPVRQENGHFRSSHLADLRSRSGFSGSPVYIYRVATSDLSAPDANRLIDNPATGYLMLGKQIKTRKDFFVGLLGVHCGQYWERVQVRKEPPERQERVGDPIVEGDSLYIQGGMTIVAPAWSIMDLLDLEVFEMARQKRLSILDREQEDRPQPE